MINIYYNLYKTYCEDSPYKQEKSSGVVDGDIGIEGRDNVGEIVPERHPESSIATESRGTKRVWRSELEDTSNKLRDSSVQQGERKDNSLES
jgi:hypothetical protein